MLYGHTTVRSRDCDTAATRVGALSCFRTVFAVRSELSYLLTKADSRERRSHTSGCSVSAQALGSLSLFTGLGTSLGLALLPNCDGG
jgi:hypothetical protein